MAERIIVVNDDPGALGGVLASAGLDVAGARDLPGALELLEGVQPEVVVIDLRWAGLDGFAACSELRRKAPAPGLGIIVLSESSSLRERVAGLTAGADDWLAKPVEGDELLARVQALVRRARALRSRSRLTGLPGPFELDLLLTSLLSQPGERFALALIDLDRLSAYNARHGYEQGDRAIAALGRLLEDCLRSTDSHRRFLAHLGTDHFAVVTGTEAVGLLLDEVMERFTTELIPELHTANEIAAGVFPVPSRRGEPTMVPLLAVSAGVATNAHRPLSSAAQASAVATEMRLLAKMVPTSAWRADRRRS